MTNYVGLDVSQKTTTLCIVDGEGHRQWRGECVTSPEQIVQAVLQHAGAEVSIGIETGPMTPWLVHEFRSRGLDVTCLDARHVMLMQALMKATGLRQQTGNQLPPASGVHHGLARAASSSQRFILRRSITATAGSTA